MILMRVGKIQSVARCHSYETITVLAYSMGKAFTCTQRNTLLFKLQVCNLPCFSSRMVKRKDVFAFSQHTNSNQTKHGSLLYPFVKIWISIGQRRPNLQYFHTRYDHVAPLPVWRPFSDHTRKKSAPASIPCTVLYIFMSVKISQKKKQVHLYKTIHRLSWDKWLNG